MNQRKDDDKILKLQSLKNVSIENIEREAEKAEARMSTRLSSRQSMKVTMEGIGMFLQHDEAWDNYTNAASECCGEE